MIQENYQSNRNYSILNKKWQKSSEIRQHNRQQLFMKSRQIIFEQHLSTQIESSNLQEESSILEEERSELQSESEDLLLHYKRSGQELSQRITESHKKKKQKPKKGKYNFHMKRIFQTPNWMFECPQNFTEYYGAARPTGKSVLILIENNSAKVYDRLGKKHGAFPIKGKNYANTILQGYLQTDGNHNSIYISDMICWRENIFTHESFQFRYNWLIANLSGLINSLDGLKMDLLQFVPINLQNLQQLYTQHFGYQKQGLYFIHKDSLYLHQLNQNALIWKDDQTSQYAKTQSNQIWGNGKIMRDGSVVTLDHYRIGCIVLQGSKNKNTMIKFKFSGLTFNQEDRENNPHFHGFQPIKLKNPFVTNADPLSKLVFQHRINYDPLTIQQICQKIGHE